MTLLHLLAALQISCGGEIADLYWQKPRTNDLALISQIISPPKLPPTTHGITEIGIERTGCFGSCPTYVCIIRSDGTVRYHGEAHVERIGNWESNIDPYEFHRLANFIVDQGYAEMPETFENNVTDADFMQFERGLPKKRRLSLPETLKSYSQLGLGKFSGF